MEPGSGKVGIPLASDPFFQFIKDNRQAREMLLSPNEHFDADKVIELALQQIVGFDNSNAMLQKRYIDEDSMSYHEKFRFEHDRPTNVDIKSPELYYAPSKGINVDDYRGKGIWFKFRYKEYEGSEDANSG